ncbi:MAG: hypothetical protein CMF31_03415 [Kordiimonas sp.]|nr:hypothetical protein [Kordiimonas sp.]|tara:strand:- start:2370 stop:2603 length:234 start_codon:yes stop_codon:yes gene_type:complete
MTRTEMLRLRKYLNDKFGTDRIDIERGMHKDGTVEVHVRGEFIGVIYKDTEDGEVSYAFQMAILEEDLPNVSDAALI